MSELVPKMKSGDELEVHINGKRYLVKIIKAL